jgi:hypothetical protein
MAATLYTISKNPIKHYLSAGDFIVVYGEAGCGKSCLARWIAEQGKNVLFEDSDYVSHWRRTWQEAQAHAREFRTRLFKEGRPGLWTVGIHRSGSLPKSYKEEASLVLHVGRRRGIRPPTISVDIEKARYHRDDEFEFTLKAPV